MKSLVLIREVPDTEASIVIAADGKSIDYSNVKFIINPYDEYAIEAGANLKENNGAESVLLAVGSENMTKNIRNALAKAADKAGSIAFSKVIHLKTADQLDTAAVAKSASEVIKAENPDIVFLGKQYIDDDDYLMAGFIANNLDYNCATVVTNIEYGDNSVTVNREIEGGSEVMELSLPAVLSLQKGVNEPRYAGMKGIMKAKKVDIEVKDLIQENKRLEFIKIEPPAQKQAGKIFETDNAVDELVNALKTEAKVI